MEIKKVKVYGIDESVEASGYPMLTEVGETNYKRSYKRNVDR